MQMVATLLVSAKPTGSVEQVGSWYITARCALPKAASGKLRSEGSGEKVMDSGASKLSVSAATLMFESSSYRWQTIGRKPDRNHQPPKEVTL